MPAPNPDAVFPEHSITAHFSFPKEEESVLAYWKDIDAFQESLRQSEGKPQYSFYDGPPFATGLPHHGHILMGTVKDIVTRYAHANGFHVERRFGWDTHGLPVEHEIDKKLGIKTKDDVLAMGIDKYNAECRQIVMRYSSEWRTMVERLGRWIDFDNDYKTLNPSFMESVWWVFKQLWNKDLVYRGLRVMPYTTGCTTPLSNFEAGQAYKDVQDPAVTVSFPLLSDPSVSLLAWTTTPWTLPTNMALCVHPDLKYVKVEDKSRSKTFILCEKLLTTLFKDPKKAEKDGKCVIVDRFDGKAMVGWEYEPLFNFYDKKDFGTKTWTVVADTYVSSDAGTGIVHQAPAFGEDDYRIALREGIVSSDQTPPLPLDEAGVFTSEIPPYQGMYLKDADKNIMRDLKSKDRLVIQSTLMHSYPFCWRSGTPLIYRVIPVWFVRVQDTTQKLVENNRKTRWVPASVGENRFQNWLENARDWNISRNRYWGTPLPLWVSEDFDEVVCIGSIDELRELSGVDSIPDLHRDKIDHITIPSKKGKGVLRRVEEVFDCWFESGSMPYAQVHYPFENKQKFEGSFPADFVAEAIDQTRGWFYTLLVLSTHLFDCAPWKNLIVCGHVLAADGKKMSKSLRNFPDPKVIVDSYGADALRLFLINSPVVRGDSLRFKEDGVKDVISRVLLPFLNSYRFFLGQAALLKKESDVEFRFDPHAVVSENVMDRWILARCQSLIQFVKTEMEAYRLYSVTPRMLSLIDELTNWYIRFNRRRLKGENGIQDTMAALQTLFETLFTLCRTLSAFIPFITENMYQGLRKFFPADAGSLGLGNDLRSLHFLPFPEVRQDYYDPTIERKVQRLQAVIDVARTLRERQVIPLKTPLKELVVFHSDQEYLSDVESLKSYLEQELNIREIVFSSDEERCGVKYRAAADARLGIKLRKDVGKVKKAAPGLSSSQVKEYLATGHITVDGVDLVAGDLYTTRFVEVPPRGTDPDAPMYEAGTDNDVVVLLDVLRRPDLEEEGVARAIINRVQRSRKKAGLVATDDVDVYYRFVGDVASEVEAIMEKTKAVITRVLRKMPQPDQARDPKQPVIMEDEHEINDEKVIFTLCSA